MLNWRTWRCLEENTAHQELVALVFNILNVGEALFRCDKSVGDEDPGSGKRRCVSLPEGLFFHGRVLGPTRVVCTVPRL